ncbi:Kinase [Hexamita inflata]|uniref:Kinase n=1 Tax=Hexamita inflata TaxID=28002 RepID=A0AA86NJA6_9EUKA|nr:Kinase [Hexamita inflata]
MSHLNQNRKVISIIILISIPIQQNKIYISKMINIQMNPKLLAAMAGRLGAGQNPYQRPQYGYNPYKAPVPQQNNNVSDVQKALPEPEYEKRKQFELLQKVHDDRAKRSQQVDNGSQERARSENANPFAKENISQPQVKPQSYVQTPTRPQVIVQKQAVQEHKPFAPIMKPPTPVKNVCVQWFNQFFTMILKDVLDLFCRKFVFTLIEHLKSKLNYVLWDSQYCKFQYK